jgi:hypothetical protein
VKAPDLDQQLIDNFQAAAVILALAAVFFGIQYQMILDAADMKIPQGPEAKKATAKRLTTALWYRIVPVGFASGTSSFLFLPSVFEIVRTSRFSPLSFDFIRTAWLVTFAFLLVTLLWICLQAVRIIKLIINARR